MPKITPFLWFDTEAEEAAKFYTSLFKNSKILSVSAMTVEFELDGVKFIALNGGPHFKFNEAVSLMVNCEDQAEVDYYWEKLSEGGQPSQCGWLMDRYGFSWQIVPSVLSKLLGDPDTAKANRATEAMLRMTKLDIAALEKAYVGEV
jgi:predicted 3-demethylubiquinone-9 3-methyltransferase (glyoxalase superfamily)